MKQCPVCLSTVDEALKRCTRCGRDLSEVASINSERENTSKSYEDEWQDDFNVPLPSANLNKLKTFKPNDTNNFIPPLIGALLIVMAFLTEKDNLNLLIQKQEFDFKAMIVPLYGIFLIISTYILFWPKVRQGVQIAGSVVLLYFYENYLPKEQFEFITKEFFYPFKITSESHILFFYSGLLLFIALPFIRRKIPLVSIVIFAIISFLIFYFVPNTKLKEPAMFSAIFGQFSLTQVVKFIPFFAIILSVFSIKKDFLKIIVMFLMICFFMFQDYYYIINYMINDYSLIVMLKSIVILILVSIVFLFNFSKLLLWH